MVDNDADVHVQCDNADDSNDVRFDKDKRYHDCSIHVNHLDDRDGDYDRPHRHGDRDSDSYINHMDE